MTGTVFHSPIVILKRARRWVGGSRTGQAEAAYSQQSGPPSSSEAQGHHHKHPCWLNALLVLPVQQDALGLC